MKLSLMILLFGRLTMKTWMQTLMRMKIFEGADVTYQEHILAIMSFTARHNLNQAQLSDLIEIIKLHCPSGGMYVSSGKSLHKEVITGVIELKYHDVCEDCFALFPVDSSLYRCFTTGCSLNLTEKKGRNFGSFDL